jgi:hypothetical protein
MGDISIYNTIRSFKVTTGNAPILQSENTFGDRNNCPVRYNVSDNGVIDVPRNSINVYSAGCSSPLNRMLVENALRPEYSYYLNTDAIQQVEGDFEYQKVKSSTIPTTNYVDTMLGNQYVRNIADNLQNTYNPSLLKGMSGTNADALSDEMQQLKNNMIMRQTYVQNNSY